MLSTHVLASNFASYERNIHHYCTIITFNCKVYMEHFSIN